MLLIHNHIEGYLFFRNTIELRKRNNMSNFTKGSIEFLTVCVETCKFMEQENHTLEDFLDKSQKLLPFIYMKAAMVEKPSKMIYDTDPEKSVTEIDYNLMQKMIAKLLGNDDKYLTAMHQDMKFSDTPIAAFISEDLADVYQSMKDFAAVGALGNEDLLNDALIVCINDFQAYWGARLLNALTAIHKIMIERLNKSVDE